MTDRTATADDLEARLRTVLADRAATVTGPAPVLPDVSVASLDEAVPELLVRAAPRPPRWRGAAVVAAAVVLAAVGLLAVVRDQGGSEDQVLTTEPPSAAAGLPSDFDPATAGSVMRINTDRDPEVAARRYLRWRLTEPGASADEVVDGLRIEAGTRDGAIVPVTWRRADGTLGGTVVVRVGERGSDIVASTAPGVDLSSVHREGDRAVGHVGTPGSSLPGPALVDVLFAGNAFPVPIDGAPAAPPHRGYGSAATGEAAFDVEVGGYDPIVSARFVEDGAVRAIAELALPAPDADSPDLSTMTDEELHQQLAQAPPDPRCTAVATASVPQGPGGTAAATEAADDPVLDLPLADSPEAAVDALAASMGVEATDLTITSPLSSGGVAGAWIDGAPVQVGIWEHGGGFEATEAYTVTACWNAGSGSGSEPGTRPRTPLSFSRVAGGETGQLWYRTDDETTSTVELGAADLARGNVLVDGEGGPIEAFAVVARNGSGDVVLVQRSTL